MNLRDAFREQNLPESFTGCWAELPSGSFCNIYTEDPLGLCAIHRREIVPGSTEAHPKVGGLAGAGVEP